MKPIFIILALILVPTVLAESPVCDYGLDKEEYLLGETVTYHFNCPYHHDLTYVVSWKNAMGGLLKDDTGMVGRNTTHNVTFTPQELMIGEVELTILPYIEYHNTYIVVNPHRYIYVDTGDTVYRIPNIGRIIVGESISPIFGWAIFFIVVWLVISFILTGPDFVQTVIKKVI